MCTVQQHKSISQRYPLWKVFEFKVFWTRQTIAQFFQFIVLISKLSFLKKSTGLFLRSLRWSGQNFIEWNKQRQFIMLTNKDYMQKISMIKCLYLFDSKTIDFFFSLIKTGMKICFEFWYVEIMIILNNLGAEEVWRNKNCFGLWIWKNSKYFEASQRNWTDQWLPCLHLYKFRYWKAGTRGLHLWQFQCDWIQNCRHIKSWC